jgi:choline-sulfatase
VPLLLSLPGAFGAGQRLAPLVEAVDLAPTVLDYCGVQAPPFFQGRSFRALLEGGDYAPRPSAYIEFKDPFRSSWKVVRTHEFKYCAARDGTELLFDLRADPHETRNVAADPGHADALHALRRELVRRWFDVEDQYPLRTGQY